MGLSHSQLCSMFVPSRRGYLISQHDYLHQILHSVEILYGLLSEVMISFLSKGLSREAYNSYVPILVSIAGVYMLTSAKRKCTVQMIDPLVFLSVTWETALLKVNAVQFLGPLGAGSLKY